MTTLTHAGWMWRPWSGFQSRVRPYAVAAALCLVLWAYVVGPMLLTLQRSIVGPGAALSAYAGFLDLGSGVVAASALGSIVLSLLSVVTAGVTGISLAVLLHRWAFPLRGVFRALILLPLALPPFMGVAAFARLYGLGGFVPQLLGTYLFGIDSNALALNGVAGVLVVHTVTMYPYFYLPVSTALANSDASLEEAATSLGASPWQTWIRVILPMLTPAIVSGALLTFMSSMGSYTAPWLFGVNKVLTRQIVIANGDGDLRFASAASVVLALFSLAFLLAFRAYERRATYWSTSKGGARKQARRVGPVLQAVLFTVATASTAFMLLPVLMIVILAFSIDGSWRSGLLPGEYDVWNVVHLFSSPHSLMPIANSLQMSALAAIAATLVGIAGSYVVGRSRLRGKAVVEVAMMLPWALPGTVVAFNLIMTFNQPSAFTLGHVLVGTYAIVPLAYFVRFAPLVFRSTTATLAQLDPSLEEAARSLGATPWISFRRVVLPLLARGILSGALLVFVGGIGEFAATTLLHAQERYKPMSIAISEAYYDNEFGTAAMLGLVQMVVVLIALIVTRQIEERSRSLSAA